MDKLFYNILQPCFGGNNLKSSFMDTDLFLSSYETDHLATELKKSQEKYALFDYGTVVNGLEKYDEANKKVLGKFGKDKPKSIENDEFA